MVFLSIFFYFFFNFADEPGCVSFSHSPESTHKVVVFSFNVDFMRHFLLCQINLNCMYVALF